MPSPIGSCRGKLHRQPRCFGNGLCQQVAHGVGDTIRSRPQRRHRIEDFCIALAHGAFDSADVFPQRREQLGVGEVDLRRVVDLETPSPSHSIPLIRSSMIRKQLPNYTCAMLGHLRSTVASLEDAQTRGCMHAASNGDRLLPVVRQVTDELLISVSVECRNKAVCILSTLTGCRRSQEYSQVAGASRATRRTAPAAHTRRPAASHPDGSSAARPEAPARCMPP